MYSSNESTINVLSKTFGVNLILNLILNNEISFLKIKNYSSFSSLLNFHSKELREYM